MTGAISMQLLLSITIGGLFAAAAYLMLRRSMVKLVLGLALLGHATNLLIFVSGGLVRGNPPLIDETRIAAGAISPKEPFADPIPQALILTAIVIAFGVQAFAVVLIKRTFQTIGSDDFDELYHTEQLDTAAGPG